MRYIICLIFAIVFDGQIYAQKNIPNLSVYDEYEKAKHFYNNNELDSAIIKLKYLETILTSDKEKFYVKDYIYVMYSLSDIYSRQGKMKRSEGILDKAEHTLLIHGMDNSPYRRMILLMRGHNRLLIDDVDNAKRLLHESKEFFEKERDILSVEYAMCLSDLALAFNKTSDYWIANILWRTAEDIFKHQPLETETFLYDQRYLTILNNLVVNYNFIGDFEMAKKIQNSICELNDDKAKKSKYLMLINNVYAEIRRGNYEKAAKIIENADSFAFDYLYKDYAFQNLILTQFLSDDDRVIDNLMRYLDYSKNNLASILLSYSESERENYWTQHSLILEMVTNAVCWKYQTPELCELAYNNTLYTKNMMLRLSKIISDYVKKSASIQTRQKYGWLTELKNRIVSTGISDDSILVIRDNINVLEREILSSVNCYTDLFDDQQITCEKIRRHLKKSEVAIEFVLFPEISSGSNETTYYGALVNHPDFSCPQFVKLCKKDMLDDVLDKKGMSEHEFVDSLYSLYNDTLYNLLVHPLMSFLNDAETIFFSPVSGLHVVNLQAIPVDNKRLMDKYELIEVSTTSKIIKEDERDRTNLNSNAFLIGGCNYSEEIDSMFLESFRYAKTFPKSNLSMRSNNRSSWDVIPGSFGEAQQIDSILRKNKINTHFLYGSKANEEGFKALNGQSPRFIHIASHGFFYAEDKEVNSSYFEDRKSYSNKKLSMLFSGILLAGANNAWNGQELPVNIEDGILTAEEISQMDLSNTDIVVLSACDTGLGKIDDIDGVYGLQRGFKMAGVESIIMSLWKISDEATQLLMVEFYKNLMAGKDKYHSLKDAQMYLRKVENRKYDKPSCWAAFIMLDGIN